MAWLWIKNTLPTFSDHVEQQGKDRISSRNINKEWKLSHIRWKEKLKEFGVLRSRCTGRFPSQDLERTGTLKELSLTSYFSLMTDFFFYTNEIQVIYSIQTWLKNLILYHMGNYSLKLRRWGLVQTANAELLKQMTRSSVERRNAGQRRLIRGTPQRSVLSPVLLVSLMTLAQQ